MSKTHLFDPRQIYSSQFKVNLHNKFNKFTFSFSPSMAIFRSSSKSNSGLYVKKVARNQVVQAFILRLFGEGNQMFSDS